jgi:hypothetical protein
MNLADFLDRYGDALAEAVIQTYPPLYDAEARRTGGLDLGRLLRRPLGAQADAIRATALSLSRHAGTHVVGEMGVGKSLIAVAAAYLAGFRRVLVLCPPHLVQKWRREVLQTVPGARVAIVRTIADMERVRTLAATPLFVVCSREQAKLGYRWGRRRSHGRCATGLADSRAMPMGASYACSAVQPASCRRPTLRTCRSPGWISGRRNGAVPHAAARCGRPTAPGRGGCRSPTTSAGGWRASSTC